MIRSTLLLLAFVAVAATARPGMDPVANPGAVIVAGEVRFTLLTSRMIRLEWSAEGKFEDQASLVFLNRRLPVPRHTAREEDGWLVVATDSLTLRYKKGSGSFTAENCAISFRLNGALVTWVPGMEDRGNLRGTTRTLDGVRGSTTLEPGLLSRDGWTIVDDSARPLFDKSPWPWVASRPEGKRQDIYFFGYGHDYTGCLYDFTLVAGKIPMPPRFAFGYWWSRYWAYTDEELKNLVKEFGIFQVPLDVLVIDMDWHLTFNQRWGDHRKDQAGQTLGWTGYTWDRDYFPDPDGFLRWCNEQGLRTPLNLHPASGIQPHEMQYPEMARAMGVDPATQKYIPFDITEKRFADAYLKHVIHPLERQGIDYWWLDWQQWGTTKIPGVTPTWWLNYVFFTDMEREGKRRPLLFHRWGGLGNHRYQIGFSGDTYSVWESLAFQPYFTATASNVGFGYWSHDIGGHMPGMVSGELYARWLQWGALSPILRTHTTKNPGAERRIWAYPSSEFLVMRDAILFRYSLIPYLYTAAREAYDTGVSLCRPMYYAYPGAEDAYAATGEYMLGDDLLVAPVTSPCDTLTQRATVNLWLPPGEWFEWYTGARLTGPAKLTRSFALDEIPVYVRAGAVIPMLPPSTRVDLQPLTPLILTVFPGPSGSFTVYEDAGNSTAYQRGEFARTTGHVRQEGGVRITIEPPKGSYPGMPRKREYEVRLPGVLPPGEVRVNGKRVSATASGKGEGWWFDPEAAEVRVRTASFPVSSRVEVEVRGAAQIPSSVADLRGRLAALKRVMPLLNNLWPKEWSPSGMVRLAQTGTRIAARPSQASAEIDSLLTGWPRLLREVEGIGIDPGVRQKVLTRLSNSDR